MSPIVQLLAPLTITVAVGLGPLIYVLFLRPPASSDNVVPLRRAAARARTRIQSGSRNNVIQLPTRSPLGRPTVKEPAAD
jgi:hypothetical protein